MFRRGEDTVASLYDVATRFPDKWPGSSDLPWVVGEWNRAVEASRPHVGKANHMFMRYEQLVAEPEAEARRLARFMGVEFDETMLSGEAADESIYFRPWMEGAGKGIRKDTGTKYMKLFDEAQRRYIESNLVNSSWIDGVAGPMPGLSAGAPAGVSVDGSVRGPESGPGLVE